MTSAKMTRPEWWDSVADDLARYQVEHADNLPGAAYGVETGRDGRLTGSAGPGWAEDTICEIGSMSKPFVAAAALLALEERGLLDIETPVCALPGMGVWAEDGVRRLIRVRHLLQHTSGLPHVLPRADWAGTPGRGDPADGPDLGPASEWIGAPGLTNEYVWTDGRYQPARSVDLDQVSLHVMRTYPVPESPPPGAEYRYSTANYILVARIIEQLTGQSANRFIKERLFTPLEMADSFFVAGQTGDPAVDARIDEGVTDEQRSRIADFVLITKDGRFPPEIAPMDKTRRGWRFVYPDAGMFSRVGDLLNFLVMIRDGGVFRSRRVLSSQIVSLLADDHGHGHTMGFGLRGRPTPYGQRAGTLEHLGMKMTYFWYDRSVSGDGGVGDSVLGVFLSQRMPNFIANTNMSEGLRPIFRVFIPAVNSGAVDSGAPKAER